MMKLNRDIRINKKKDKTCRSEKKKTYENDKLIKGRW